MLEIVAPMRKSSNEAALAFVERIKKETAILDGIDYLNVPEIVDENYAGQPLYRHMDACEFSALLKKSMQVEVIVNKAVAYMKSEDIFKEWVHNAASSYGIRDIVIVGGSSNLRNYPGPQVMRANEMASSIKGLRIGNICIPSRKGEADRLVLKTRSGASFFTTQLLLEPSEVEDVLLDYSSKCSDADMRPATFFLSFGPAAAEFDIDFFKWLGASIPDDIEHRLRRSANMGSESIAIALESLSDIESFIAKEELGVKIGVNVEAISNSNLTLACRMLSAIQLKHK